ncbi:lipoprotein [Streptomyces libani subsp. rufus]|nr:lipoprotein [Streptomyces libani subsp. rufus]
MVYTPRSARHGALLVGTVAVLGLLSACGDGSGAHSAGPATVSGTAAPARDTTEPPVSPTATAPSPTDPAHPAKTAKTGSASAPRTTGTAGGSGATTTPAAASTRCHTAELRATVGRNDPGAGQENFPVVLTNTSARTCTLRGYPGAAFVDTAGTQLGPDPRREPGTPVTVTLKPGHSAWAGLTFSNPEISGAKTATPAALLVTPPDERAPLKAAWRGGPVPVAGNSSSVRLTVLAPGTGP